MAKKRKVESAGSDDEPLKMRWNLFELPTSQHRAGLAGLALCVDYLRRKTDRSGLCEIENVDDKGLTLVVNREGMQSLFDVIYAARLEEVVSKSKWPGTEPKAVKEVKLIDEKANKERTEKRFVYDRVVPSGLVLADWEAVAPGEPKLWLKLWQDLVWTTLRGVPATREPYNARAEKRPIDDGQNAFDELRSKPGASVELPSTYALGAQAKSAENVPISDIARFRFLLHFWPIAAAIYVPAILQRDGKREFVGYAIAMPDVADLASFMLGWQGVAQSRGKEAAGYVPREAVIDLVAEAGLDLVRRCNFVIGRKQKSAGTAFGLSGVDVFHLEKEGNNVRLRSTSRIVPTRTQVDEYTRVHHAGYWSPVFRRQRVANVLDSSPWWSGYGRLCAITPKEMTIEHDSFRHDCRIAFKEIEMTDVSPELQQLEHLVFNFVQGYVLGKTERKHELAWKDVQGKPEREKEYREKREKIAREAFLAVRSRTGADFVEYFTSTICSVPHRLSQEKYLELAKALTRPGEVERVRSLTLLALSAVA